MTHARIIPSWWHTLPGVCPRYFPELLAEVERLGVSRNDRTTIEHIWHEQQIARALRKFRDRQDPQDA